MTIPTQINIPGLLLSFALLLLAGNALGQQHNFLTYSLEEGLPQSQVFALASDSKGYLWMGTQGGGLSRFDGQVFLNFTTSNGLPSNYVYSIFEDESQTIWVGAGQGLAKVEGIEVFSQELPEEISRVSALWQQNDSTLWLGTNAGIWSLDLKRGDIQQQELHQVLDKSFITSFCDHTGVLWISTVQGMFKVADTVTYFPLGIDQPLSIQAIAIDTSGQFWLASFGQGLLQWNGIDQEAISLFGTDRQQATHVYVGQDQRVWLSTQNKGVWIYQPADESWIQLTEKAGLPNNNVRSITEDRWGNTWMATSGGGVTKYLGQFFLHYDRQNGLPDNRVYAVDVDSAGTIWASVGNAGLVRLDSSGFRPFLGDSSFLSMKAKALLFDQGGHLWVGTEGSGLLRFDTSGFQIINRENGLQSDWIRAIEEDRFGQIWVATYGSGIARVIDQDTLGMSVRRYGQESGLNDLRILDLEFDENNRLWYSTRFGEVGYLLGGRVAKLFGAEEGLPNVQIRSIAFDSLGQIWLGTAGEGLYVKSVHPDSLKFRQFLGNAELSSSNLYLVLCDKEGNMWVGNERGIDKILLNDAGVYTEIQSFGRNEGFLGIETTLNTTLCDSEGNLWFGTLNGLTKHIPSERTFQATVPLIHFRTISLFYRPLQETVFAEWASPGGGIRQGLELPYKQNHLRFSFRAVDLNDPGLTRYRWKLEGIETEWSPLTDQESVNYTNLPPGEYTFFVQSTTDEEQWSEPITASFLIKRPYWQLLWVQLVAGGALLGLLFVLVRLRIRAIKKREARKRGELEMANRMLQLEQKALQLQMNPHFIFNALNSIQSLVATKDFSTARREINNFAGLMRGILSNSRKQQISLQEEVDTLHRYLQMEQFCQTTPFKYNINIPDDLDAEEVEIPPMLLQPFVENAVIHGISHLKHEGQLAIQFKAESDLLICDITDNGVGRERAEALRRSKAPGHQSVAMQVTRERLEALLSEHDLHPLEISDVVGEDHKIAGTRVLVRLPLQRNF